MKRIREKNINPTKWTLRGLEREYNRKDRQKSVEKIFELLDPNDVILDVGVGGGIEIKILRELGAINTIDICDHSELSLAFVGNKTELMINVGFLCDLRNGIAKADDSYDVVMLLEVLEHMDNPKAVVTELLRITKKKLIICVPYGHNHHGVEHNWEFTEEGFNKLSRHRHKWFHIDKFLVVVYYK